MNNSSFKPFYFEGNLGWGIINTPEDFLRIIDNYRGEGGWPVEFNLCLNKLLTATLNVRWSRNDQLPDYGFRSEHTDSKKNLREFLGEDGVLAIKEVANVAVSAH